MSASDTKLLRVGELAKAAGKTVRTIHLYEELGLLRPTMRTDGGFRLYHPDALARIAWVCKLQATGFKLSEIQEFVKEFECAPSGRVAANRAREVFAEKLCETRAQIAQLQAIETDLVAALAYLDVCQDCSPAYAPTECSECDHQGHERGSAPALFANLSRTAVEEVAQRAYDVAVTELKKGAGAAVSRGASGNTERRPEPVTAANPGAPVDEGAN